MFAVFLSLVGYLANAKVLAVIIIDEATGFMTIEVRRTDDKIGHIEGHETVAIEVARMALWQHEGLADNALGIDVTEIGPCEEAVVATRTEHQPAGVRAPVVERFCVFRVCLLHGTSFSCHEVEQPEVGLMVPDTELSVVGECVAKESPVVRGTGEGYRFVLSLGIDDDVYLVAELARFGVEIDAAEVIVDGVELMTAFREGAGRTEIERTAIGREHGIGLIDRVIFEQG